MSEQNEDTQTPAPKKDFSTLEEKWKVYNAEMKHVTDRLEKRYENRGLKFTRAFVGSIPVQAFGTIDDMIFYFRYRGDYGQLEVGFIKEDRFDLEYERDVMFHEERVRKDKEQKAQAKAAGIAPDPDDYIFESLWLTPPIKKIPTDEDMPTSLRKVAYVQNYLDSPYNGTLTLDECEDLFTRLVEGLEDVEQERQVIDETVGLKYGRNPDMSRIIED